MSTLDPEDLAGKLAELANQLFRGGPTPAVPGAIDAPVIAPQASSFAGPVPAFGPTLPPNIGPNALNVGAAGISGAQSAPPTPGFLQAPPIANAPLPRESDLRNLPTTVAQSFGAPSPVLASAPLLDATAPAGDVPYFLTHAGLPGGAPTDVTAAPALPAPDLGRVTTDFAPAVVPDVRTPDLFDAHAVKRQFPILNERVHGKPLVWLDNAATTQKPQVVIDRVSSYYEHENSNIHRAAHTLAARATDAYEGARATVARFLRASSAKDIVFVRGATEAINLVAKSWGGKHVEAGDEIVVTWLEHHANIVPWQQLCAATGAKLCVVPVDDRGQVILEEYERRLTRRTRIVSITQVSNALGTIVPVAEMTAIAKRHGATVLVDGAQAVSHMPVDVQAIGCDFYVFSGHKIFAPTGIGALYGTPAAFEALPPWQGGGNMIADVTFERTTYQPAPMRFEAGTGSIADAVGLGAALDWLDGLGLPNVARHEHDLLVYATEQLARVPRLRIIGTAPDKAGVISFVIGDMPTESIGRALDREGIAVRSGHHCAQPILRRYGLESTVRASFAPYNTREDVDALTRALLRIAADGGV
jgi:cysteine desulfurase/selenocysteine lyase